VGVNGRINIHAVARGLDLAANAALTVADGGRIHIVFRRPEAARRGIAWALRWKGDHVATLNALATGKTPGLVWDDTALGAKAGIFFHAGATYLGIKP